MIQKLKKNEKGFTLVELIVVIAILGVLAAVLVPQYIQYIDKARVASDQAAIGEITHAVEISASEEAVYADISGGAATLTLTVDAAGKVTITSSSAALQTAVLAAVPANSVTFKSAANKKAAVWVYTISSVGKCGPAAITLT